MYQLLVRVLAGDQRIVFRLPVYVRDTGYDLLLGNPALRETGLKSFFADPARWSTGHDPPADEESEEANPEAIDRSLFADPSATFGSSPSTCTAYRSVSLDPKFPLYAELAALVAEFGHLWSPVTRSDAINHPGAVFDLTLRDGYDTTLRKFSPRHVSPHIEAWLRTEIDALVELGICEPCRDSPVAHPIVVATKLKLRMCVDYSVWLNQWTGVPIPSINYILEQLSRGTYFAQLDLAKAFHQLTVRPEDRWKLAFTTVFGNYTFCSLPFGPTNGPMKFQQIIESILADVSRTYPFIDDINSSGDTPREFLTILRDVLTRLSDAGVRLNPKKTRLGFLDAEILGRHVSHNSVSLTDDRKRTILGIPFPKTRKQMRSFLGQALFFQPFVRYYAILAAPLNAAISGSSDFRSTPALVR